MPIEFTPSRQLLTALQQLKGRVRLDRGQAQQGNDITTETIDAVLGNSQYQVKGKTLSTTGVSPDYTAGERVLVAWRGGAPVVILGHTARRAQFNPILTPSGLLGVVEELFCAPSDNPPQVDVWFRNYDNITPLHIRQFLNGDPTGVKWGADRKSFVVQTGAGASRKWYVFAFDTKKGDTVVAPSKGPGKTTLVRVEDPYHNTQPFIILTADRQEKRRSIGVMMLNYSATQYFVGFFYNPEFPATGLGIHTEGGSSVTKIEQSLATVSTQHTILTLPLTLQALLGNSIAGLTSVIIDYYLDKDRNFILNFTLAFVGASILADGTRTRGGTQPKPFDPTTDNFGILNTEPGSTPGVDLPTLGPVSGIALAPYLAERHVFVVNTTPSAGPLIVFSTTRPTLGLTDETDYALPAMATFNPISINRFMQARQDVSRVAGRWVHFVPPTPSEGVVTYNQYFGTLEYGFDLEGTAYATVLADMLAFQALGDAPPAGGLYSPVNVFYDLNNLWPDGIRATGLRRAQADLWNHSFPWIGGGDSALDLGPLPTDPALDFDYGLMSSMSSVVSGENNLANPPSNAGMNSTELFIALKYSIAGYQTRAAIPTAYRVTDARVLAFGSQGYLYLALERVTNSGTLSSPVWTKAVALYILRFTGTMLSNLLSWTPIGVSPTSIPHYQADAFQGFYDDGTKIDFLSGDSPRHVLWGISTLAERDADVNFRHIKLSNVISGTSVDVGTDLARITAQKFSALGIDFLYDTNEPGPKGRRFIKAWDFKTGSPTLSEAVLDYPVVDSTMTPVATLLDLPTSPALALTGVQHYHGILDRSQLQGVNRFFPETADPYPVT